MSKPMNDEEVLSEMKKMVAFIKQEAVEKAREIQVKADEEFAIEKVNLLMAPPSSTEFYPSQAKIVRQEAVNIDSSYDKKKKQAVVSQKMWVALPSCYSILTSFSPVRSRSKQTSPV